MTDVMEQLTGADSSSSQEGALGGAPPTTEGSPAARPDTGATTEAQPKGQTPEGTPESKPTETDWKAKAEEEKRLREKSDESYRAREAELNRLKLQAQRAEAEANQARAERAARVEAILKNPDVYGELMADPARWQAFNAELVQVEMDKRQAQQQQDTVRGDWEKATWSLQEWACLKDDGPKMGLPEWTQWLQKYGRAFASYGADVETAMEAARAQIKGMYFDRFASKVRSSADEDAHRKAMATLKDGNPPGSSPASLGKPKPPDEAYLEDLGSAPGFQNIRELFSKT